MATDWLTSEVVEGIEQAVSIGRKVESFVSSLRNSTLTGILEYGCARWHNGALPALPSRILESPLGQSLQLVSSELGFGAAGPNRLPVSPLSGEPQEFHVLSGGDSTLAQGWSEYQIRFRQSMTRGGFSRDDAIGIVAALGEMAENATIHSRALVGVLVGYQVLDGAAVCSVVDVGDGILASLSRNPAYQYLSTHKDAVRLALRPGVSCLGPGGGSGFNSVFKALTAKWGTLRFRSGEGCVTMDGCDFSADKGAEAYVPFRPGFQVTICCRTSVRPDSIPLV